MKTREDFVSNSSSCSFIIVDLESRSADVLAKDIAKMCSRKNNSSKDLLALNKCTFEYCIRNYVLLYFGSIVLGKCRAVITESTYKTSYGYDDVEAKNMWNEHAQILRDIAEKKCKNMSKCEKECYADEVLDEEKKQIVKTYDILVHGMPVLKDRMSIHMFGRNQIKSSKVRKDEDSKAVQQILEYVKNLNSIRYDQRPTTPYIYSITIDSVLNTKALLKAGIKMSFDDTIWTKKMMSKIEKLLKEGKKVYYVEQGYDGDYADSGRIYCEENAGGIAAVDNIEALDFDII